MTIRKYVLIAALTAWLVPSPSPIRADDPPKPAERSWLNPLRYCDLVGQQISRVRHIEGVEMVSAVIGGSDMGPGEGWFHGSQSRYDWQWLAGRHHVKPDGKISRKDFQGDPALFDRLDRDQDGFLTAKDFDWSDKSPFNRQSGLASQWMSLLDADANGRISKTEWEAFFAKAAKGKDHLTVEDLRAALNPPPPPPEVMKKLRPTPMILMKGLVQGELGSFHEGPEINESAPDFFLKTQDGKDLVTLSQFRGRKPVVLVFGSFT